MKPKTIFEIVHPFFCLYMDYDRRDAKKLFERYKKIADVVAGDESSELIISADYKSDYSETLLEYASAKLENRLTNLTFGNFFPTMSKMKEKVDKNTYLLGCGEYLIGCVEGKVKLTAEQLNIPMERVYLMWDCSVEVVCNPLKYPNSDRVTLTPWKLESEPSLLESLRQLPNTERITFSAQEQSRLNELRGFSF